MPQPKRRVYHPIGEEPSATKQEFAQDCDINHILGRFQRTGAMQHFAKYAPQYGDFNAIDYQTAQNTILRAQKMFDELPSKLRALVATPAGFLDFVQDPANAKKMEEFGLITTPPPLAKPPEITPDTPPA